jgi:hypothetical protein
MNISEDQRNDDLANIDGMVPMRGVVTDPITAE